MAKRRRDTFVPLDDTCQVCHRKISWMFGGLFWLHYDSRNVDHRAPNPAPPGEQLRKDYLAEHGKWWEQKA